MPVTVQVKVNTVGTTTRGNSNMVELTGYDHSNNKGFKKMFFEEKKSGGMTQAATVAQTLVQDNWCEITMDDSSYHNVTMIKKIATPDGAPAESQGAGSSGGGSSKSYSSGGGSGGSDKMSKEEWAAKDLKKDVSVARSVALKAAVEMAGTGINKTNVSAIQKLAPIFELYLLHGDFSYVAPEPVAKPEPVAQPDNTPDTDNEPEDDDIPF